MPATCMAPDGRRPPDDAVDTGPGVVPPIVDEQRHDGGTSTRPVHRWLCNKDVLTPSRSRDRARNQRLRARFRSTVRTDRLDKSPNTCGQEDSLTTNSLSGDFGL